MYCHSELVGKPGIGDALGREVVVERRQAETGFQIGAHSREGRLGRFHDGHASATTGRSGKQQHGLVGPDALVDPGNPVVEIFESGGVGAVVFSEGNDDPVVARDEVLESPGISGDAVGFLFIGAVDRERKLTEVEVGDFGVSALIGGKVSELPVD